MSALCKRLTNARQFLPGRVDGNGWKWSNQMRWNVAASKGCSTTANDKQVEPSFTSPGKDVKAAAKPHQKLSRFQKRLLYTCGRYPSMADTPDFAGESELRYATDICKTLFNIWCMMFLASFFFFLHFIEKRRMQRLFARHERQESKRMLEMDKVNKEIAARRKLQSA